MRWVRVLPATTIMLALFIGACGGILLKDQPPLTSADVIVVLGNSPPADAAGRVMPETRRRVQTGVRLWRRGLAPIMLMTGGPAPHGLIEAEVMKAYAVRLGVPPQRIMTERKSRSTIGNARLSVALLCRRKVRQTCAPSLIVVSSPYHLVRARKLFVCAGARVQVAATPIPKLREYRQRSLWIERIARFGYAFIDECAMARPTRSSSSPRSSRTRRTP